MSNPTASPVVSSFSKPVVSAEVNRLAQSAVSKIGAADNAVASFLYATARHPHIGRADSRGVSVTLVKGSDPVVVGTMTDVYALVGLTRTTGARRLRAHVLGTEFPEAPVFPADKIMSAPVTAALFTPGAVKASHVIREGVTLADVVACHAAVTAPVAPVADAAPGSDAEDAAPEPNLGGGSTPDAPGENAPVVPRTLSARADMIEAILATVTTADLTSDDYADRLATIATTLEAILSTPSHVVAMAV